MNKKFNILIVDDEAPARSKIKSYIKNMNEAGTIHEASNGFEAVKLINEISPDLVFLDIQMPKANGFEVIDAIGIDEMPAVVFVTAYDEYAIEAFNVEAVDYLLKPFDEERFLRAFNRAKERINHSNTPDLKNLLSKFKPENEYIERIMVEKASKYKFVNVDEIFFIAAQDKYVELNTGNERYLVRDTMTRMEERLNPDKFKRTHRSFIVNVDYIKEIQPWAHGDYVILMENGNKVKLARRFKKNIFGN